MNAQTQKLEQAFHQLHDCQDRVLEERVRDGAVRERAHADYEAAVMRMRERLKPLIDGGQAGQKWQRANIELIPDVCARRQEVETVGVYGLRQSGVEVNHAPIEQLDRWAEVLVEIYGDVVNRDGTDTTHHRQ